MVSTGVVLSYTLGPVFSLYLNLPYGNNFKRNKEHWVLDVFSGLGPIYSLVLQ